MFNLLLLLLPAILAKSEQLSLTEAEIKPYDGTDASKPIYLALNGTIYDVSASPKFYGPGGAYSVFSGRDASRAWVSGCFDSEEQLTWRMEGLEQMFTPRYLDEELEKAGAGGDIDLDLGGIAGSEMISQLAEKALAKIGRVPDDEKATRRKQDKEEAEKKVDDTFKQWVDFLEKSPKYEAVGKLVYDEATPAPPKLCEKAMKQRPLKGGRLDSLMNVADMGKKYAAGENGEIPDFVKAKLNAQQGGEDDAHVKDEL